MPRLLIVSDESDQRTAIQEAAEGAGYRPDDMTCPESWEDAVRVQAEDLYHVAVVDLELWGRWEGGVDYIRQLHVEQPACLIIAITGRRSDEAGVRAMRAGASDFINTEWDLTFWKNLLMRKLHLYRQLAEPTQQASPA